MDYERFMATVERRGHLDRDAADTAVTAVLQTLAERLSKGEARQLVEQLPVELSPLLLADHPHESFDVDEFLRRVAAREDVDIHTAELDARTVFAVLREAVDPDEFDDVLADLPDDFRPILLNLVVPDADELIREVSAATDLSRDEACRATEAVLTTLAERVPPGEVDDLVARLPVELHEPLKQGRAGVVAMPADEFVRRVADREGVSTDDARRHIRAVLAVLRDAVTVEEFSDVVVELSKDYDDLLPRP